MNSSSFLGSASSRVPCFLFMLICFVVSSILPQGFAFELKIQMSIANEGVPYPLPDQYLPEIIVEGIGAQSSNDIRQEVLTKLSQKSEGKSHHKVTIHQDVTLIASSHDGVHLDLKEKNYNDPKYKGENKQKDQQKQQEQKVELEEETQLIIPVHGKDSEDYEDVCIKVNKRPIYEAVIKQLTDEKLEELKKSVEAFPWQQLVPDKIRTSVSNTQKAVVVEEEHHESVVNKHPGS